MRQVFFLAGALLILLSLGSKPARASQRHFTYTYEVYTASAGEVELENWVTWLYTHGHNGEPSTHEFDFRHEFEFGITDRLQLSLYVADWHITDHTIDGERSHYDDAAAEVVYRLSDPVTNLLGSAIYGEVRGGKDLFALEGKLLLQKNFGKWVTAYNAVVEGKWVGDNLRERNGEIAQTAAVSYEISPRFTVGAEALHEIDLPNWEEAEPSVVWLGPNASLRSGRWYMTATVLARLTSNEAEPRVQTRLITGFDF
jgi:hypothetical protein